ncbi:MAG TPA: hypothetical protein VIL35_06340 [Vicinamibacterales bacterium]
MPPVVISSMPAASAANRRVTLWTAASSDRDIACVAEPHPLGLELRYVLNGRLLMSRVFDSWDRLCRHAQSWRDAFHS